MWSSYQVTLFYNTDKDNYSVVGGKGEKKLLLP